MTAYLLDTNVPSELIRSQPDARVNAWFLSQESNMLHLSVITVGELRTGATTLPDSRRRASLEDWIENDLLPSFADRVLPVTLEIADRWGKLRGLRKLAGRPLSMPDVSIAATAMEHGLTLVTRNRKDYVELGVEILNPWEI